MNYEPTEKQLQKWGKVIVKSINGFTKCDLEPLFEKFILPFYYFACRNAVEETKWKIIDRETGEEYSVMKAQKEVEKLRGNFN